MTEKVKRYVPAALFTLLLGSLGGFIYQWGQVTEALAQYGKQVQANTKTLSTLGTVEDPLYPIVKEQVQVIADQVTDLKDDVVELRNQSAKDWAEQRAVNTEVLKVLYAIKGKEN